MSVSEVLRLDFVLGLPLGLLLGAGLGRVAQADRWGGYASFRRRATRLGHVAAVMLPALAGLYATLPAAALESPAGRLAAGLWTIGLISLPSALLIAAPRPQLAPRLVPVPAALLIAAAACFAFALFSSGGLS